jgi:IS30 family transposase
LREQTIPLSLESIMGMQYSQLTEEERNQIYALLQDNVPNRRIARIVNKDASTIGREIRRNRGLRGYRPRQANQKAVERRKTPHNIKMTPEVLAHINEKLSLQYSPEQIYGTMKERLGIQISPERIYQHIWQDKKLGGDLYRNLRIAGGRKRRKRYGKKDWRGKIPNRVDIDQRPTSVNEKSRIGDFEADLVSGMHHQGFLVTLVDRLSKFTLIGHVSNKFAADVTSEIVRLLTPYNSIVHTITYDNGREFAGHETVNDQLGCKSFFAKPYHSWERGLNENTNGLFRQYFPKQSDLRHVNSEKISFVMERLNARPRKSLEFVAPQHIFLHHLFLSKPTCVALGG